MHVVDLASPASQITKTDMSIVRESLKVSLI